MTRRASQERLEQVNRSAYAARELMDEWDNRLTLDNRRFVQRYIEAELHFLVWLRYLSSDLVAVIERSELNGLPRDPHVTEPGRAADRSVRSRERLKDFREAHRRGEQQAVLVDYVESVELPEGVPRLVSRIQVQRFHDFERVGGNTSLYLGERSGFKLLPSLGDRKDIVLCGGIACGRYQFAVKKVERGSKVVDRVTSDEADCLIGEWDLLVEAVNQVARLHILVADDLVRVFVSEPLDDAFEFRDVFLGPFDLRPRASARRWHEGQE